MGVNEEGGCFERWEAFLRVRLLRSTHLRLRLVGAAGYRSRGHVTTDAASTVPSVPQAVHRRTGGTARRPGQAYRLLGPLPPRSRA